MAADSQRSRRSASTIRARAGRRLLLIVSAAAPPPAAELASRPVLERTSSEPAVLISLGERGDFGVMAKTERLLSTARRDAGGDPGIVSQRLVIQVSSFDDSRVSAPAVPIAPEMKPVADPPSGRVGHDRDPVAETHPVLEFELVAHVQRVPGEPPAATVRQWFASMRRRSPRPRKAVLGSAPIGVRIVTAATRARICGNTGPARPGGGGFRARTLWGFGHAGGTRARVM